LEGKREESNVSTRHTCTQLSKSSFSLFNKNTFTRNGRRIEKKGLNRGRKKRDDK